MTDPSAQHQAEGDREAVEETLAHQSIEEQDPDAPAAGVVGSDDSPPEPDEPG